MNKEEKQGFTLLETLISLIAFGIISLTVGMMLVQGWSGWHRSNQWVGLQRDAALVSRVISREIRCSYINDITNSINAIEFAGNGVRSDSGPESISCVDRDLIYTQDGKPFVLAKDSIEDFSVVKGPDHLVVTLTYHPSYAKTAEIQEFVIYTRN